MILLVISKQFLKNVPQNLFLDKVRPAISMKVVRFAMRKFCRCVKCFLFMKVRSTWC